MSGTAGDTGNAFSAMINGVEHFADDMSHLVSHATDELSSLGISSFSGVEAFVKFLIDMQQDPVNVISTLSIHIAQFGGDVSLILEELADGVITHGAPRFFEMKATQALTPIKDALSQQTTHGNTIADVHTTTLSTMKTKLDALKTSNTVSNVAWQGASVEEMSSSFDDISKTLNELSDQIQHDSHQAILNRTFMLVLEGIGILAIGMALLDILLLIVGAIGITAVGVGTAGIGFAVGVPVGAIAWGALIASEVELLLALVAADALLWLIGTLAIYSYHHLTHKATAIPVSTTHTPLVSSGKTLPNPNDKGIPETPTETSLIDQLANEFGGNIPRDLLQYLVRWLGASALTAAMIRCLYQNGYLNTASLTANRSTRVNTSYKKAWEAIYKHFTPNDLEGAWKENNSDQVDTDQYNRTGHYSGSAHDQEVEEALNSLDKLDGQIQKQIDNLNNYITRAPNPNSPDILTKIAEVQSLTDVQNAFQDLKKFVKSKIAPGSPPPNTWPDQGQVPIIEDLLQISTCKVPGAQYYR
ncbi:hypothetical protein [Tengunoibacter tsumagoiensis]|uniref:Uncharacterized protein n=1 Tax=Tengunoibacter tsumagoiensis TaxID=2014871 RepID=A0A401ZXZ9_9CHLR|nr:hypothetical protein [Tengunoibacter tsumagoiensis]GCE11721.1 hypothetical protein KTT_15800 [Tengunoibacter tsumagoiensis]